MLSSLAASKYGVIIISNVEYFKYMLFGNTQQYKLFVDVKVFMLNCDGVENSLFPPSHKLKNVQIRYISIHYHYDNCSTEFLERINSL